MSEAQTKKYYTKTAGHLMTTAVPVVIESAMIGDIEQLLIKRAKEFETINYIYAVDSARHLQGVISVKEVFSSSKQTKVASLIKEKIVSVRPHTHQERIALLALEHNIKAVPVVDKDNAFLGVVTSDTILRVLNSEHVEDILRFGGVLHSGTYDDIFHLPILTSLKHRLPWLLLGLLGGLAAAGVVSSFEKVLSQNLILAAFIPLVAYMAGAVGTQMEAFIIRDLAVNPALRFVKYFLRQALIVVLIGLLTSAAIYVVSFALYQSLSMSLVLGLALFFAVFSSLVTGLTVPYLFGKFNLDPANASGPVATIIQDVLSVFIYLIIASSVL